MKVSEAGTVRSNLSGKITPKIVKEIILKNSSNYFWRK